MASDAPQEGLGHVFAHPELLAQALTHRSFGATHNERLEFIGDAVLNCAIAAALYARFPQMNEGDLSRLRANLVNRDTLAGLARDRALGAAIRLGEGEVKSGGALRPSILADAFEAVIGAVFLDAGFDAARDVIARVYATLIERIDPDDPGKDPKTRLQEWLQARRIAVPDYGVVVGRGRGARADVHRRMPDRRARHRHARRGRQPTRRGAGGRGRGLRGARRGGARIAVRLMR